MKINNLTADEWVKSDAVLVADGKTAFYDHYERRDGALAAAWPPDASDDNSEIIPPIDVIIRTDATITADGADTATVEIETTADETRELVLSVAGNTVATHQIDSGQTITETITTTTTADSINVDAAVETAFSARGTIEVIQP